MQAESLQKGTSMNINYNITSSNEAVALVILLITCILIACCMVAYFLSISMMVKTAKEKGCPWGGGRLWFIGLFTTPIVLGIIVAALPDRR